MPDDLPHLGDTGEIISKVIGWTYTIAWGLTNYPQIYINWKRKSVQGLSPDYVAVNVIGFLCLAAYYSSFYFSEYVRAEYRRVHDEKEPLVSANDVAFSLHALLLSSITLVQLCIYPSGGQKVSKAMTVIMVGIILALIGYCLFAGIEHNPSSTMSLLYFFSYVKGFVTTVKYIPQAYMNYTRKSTKGWSILFSVLDLTGGVLSITQLMFDGWRKEDWEGVRSNPLKLFLGIITCLFDLIFIFQHYILYPQRKSYRSISRRSEEGEDTKILVRYASTDSF
ncbi:cystinosin precursor [Planoprotostelium fungivorum]|uniref:Cystinosin n=1 Tax=Planoprotostelium fungivorum TaxID=1890364 RepID=A0A2P6NQ52_9EUKA|nr:cystinosin precursor [Planoprotostelium fungivorum]